MLRVAYDISVAHGFSLACRSADLLHVAYAKALGTSLFVRFDSEQVDLARAAGLEAIWSC